LIVTPFFHGQDTALQQKLLQETFKLVSKRHSYMCNFIEGSTTSWGKDTKLVYRHYATLYFVFVVDESESELGILDLIQTFVEALDRIFRNVCELDMILHVDRVVFLLFSYSSNLNSNPLHDKRVKKDCRS
jgi:AP-3 complex subunit sigma